MQKHVFWFSAVNGLRIRNIFYTDFPTFPSVGTSTKTSANLLPEVQILTCIFLFIKDRRFGFVRIDSYLVQLLNKKTFRILFLARWKGELSHFFTLCPTMPKASRGNFYLTDRSDDMYPTTHKNQLLKSCSHMHGNVGGKAKKLPPSKKM